MVSNFFLRLATAGLVALALPAHANHYSIVDLGSGVQGARLNVHADVAGSALGRHAIAFRGKAWHLLFDGANESVATAINDLAQVAGTVQTRTRDRAVLWGPGKVRVTVPMPAGGANGYPRAINNLGLVAGWHAATPAGIGRCFLYTPGSGSIDLGLMGEGLACYALGINEAGQVVGGAPVTRHGGEHAFLWQDGLFRDLGTLGGDLSEAAAIDEHGHVVGTSLVGKDKTLWHAFMWRDGAMKDLGTAPAYSSSYASGINGHGEIVGYAAGTADGLYHAVRYEAGQAVELASEVDAIDDWHLDFAYDVNERGVILGSGRRGDGYHTFLLVPQAD